MPCFAINNCTHNIKVWWWHQVILKLSATCGRYLHVHLQMSRIKDIIVGITPTPVTDLYPMATSCQTTRTETANGLKVNTNSADGIYK